MGPPEGKILIHTNVINAIKIMKLDVNFEKSFLGS